MDISNLPKVRKGESYSAYVLRVKDDMPEFITGVGPAEYYLPLSWRRSQSILSFNRPIVKAQDNTLELYLYGAIGDSWDDGDVGAIEFIDTVKAAGDVENIDVRINSPGGDVFEGFAIYNYLANHQAKVTTHVDGMALSIASVVAMAGDEREMAGNSLLMVHNPWTAIIGDANDLRSEAAVLDKVGESIELAYAGVTNEEADFRKLMDQETWFSAQEALDLGLATSISEPLRIAASFDLSRCRNAPQAALDRVSQYEVPVEKYSARYAALAEFIRKSM